MARSGPLAAATQRMVAALTRKLTLLVASEAQPILRAAQAVSRVGELRKWQSRGRNVRVDETVMIHHPRGMVVGNFVEICEQAYIDAEGGVLIGDGARIGPRVVVMSSAPLVSGAGRSFEGERDFDPVEIGAGAILEPGATVMPGTRIGAGAILCPFVTLTSNIRIGEHFHANLYSYVEHDCVIGDFVTFAPGVQCNGNVLIEDHAYIGAGAILRQGRPDSPLVIGRGAIVGMGAVVTRNVAPGSTVVGNPARPLRTETE